MSFWDHLDVLRGILIRIAVVVLATGIALFCFMPVIFDNVILAPCNDDFPLYRLFDRLASLAGEYGASGSFSVSLINTRLASQFFIHISLSCELAVVLSFPYIIYMLWTFVRPGLLPRERRGAGYAFLFGNLLFYLGVAVGYFLVFPLTLRFLASYQLSEMIPNTITIDSYMENFMSMLLVMGVLFEMPLLAWMLGRLGVLNRGFFSRWRRHAIVVLIVAAAVITPTSDPFTLFAVFIPLYMLWEFSSILVPIGRD